MSLACQPLLQNLQNAAKCERRSRHQGQRKSTHLLSARSQARQKLLNLQTPKIQIRQLIKTKSLFALLHCLPSSLGTVNEK